MYLYICYATLPKPTEKVLIYKQIYLKQHLKINVGILLRLVDYIYDFKRCYKYALELSRFHVLGISKSRPEISIGFCLIMIFLKEAEACMPGPE